MNDKEYSEMIDLPVNSCEITYKKPKKTRKKKLSPESVKEKLIEKVNNSDVLGDDKKDPLPDTNSISEGKQEDDIENEKPENGILSEPLEKTKEEIAEEENELSSIIRKKQPTSKKQKKFSVIGLQLTIIGVLTAVIFLTNSLYANSGINVFFRSVFGKEQTVVSDQRIYSDFTPVFDNYEYITLTDGKLNLPKSSSVYSPLDGKVTSLSKENGKYKVEILHNDNFKTIISGIDYFYQQEGDLIYKNIPIGYTGDSDVAVAYFSDGNAILTNFTLSNDYSVIWAV